MTWRTKILHILKAIVRPDKTQKQSQKEKINHNIDRVKKGIDQFDRMMDELRTGLDQASGKGETKDYTALLGKPEEKDYSALLGKRDTKFF